MGYTLPRRTGVSREVVDVIRRVVLEEAGKLGVRVERIILFGSRARGEAREDSDYDVIVVVRGQIPGRIRRKMAALISRRLYQRLGIDADLVVVSSEHWEKYSEVPGTILYPARREGIKIG